MIGKVTIAMVKAAKPAAFTGYIYNSKLRKMVSVCWPGVKFKGGSSVIVLERRRCASAVAAETLASKILADRLKDMIKEEKSV